MQTILNFQQPLNFRNLYTVLNELQSSKKLVIFKGSDKIFSSGGDIKELCSYDTEKAKEYFQHPMRLFHLVHNYKIPYISIMNGVCFGAASNLTVSAKKYRIATEVTDFAMPEAKIGFFTDNGASFFLSRLARNVGFYISLASPRIKGYDVKRIGLADHYIETHKLGDLEKELVNAKNSAEVESILSKFSSPPPKETQLESILPKIDKCFDGDSVEEIIDNLHLDGSDWAMETVKLLNTNAPSSLKICHKELTLGKSLSLEECLKMEYRIATRQFNPNGDFYEGVRSLLIDRDNKPQWKHKALHDVKAEFVDGFFKPLADHEELTFKE